MRRAGASACLLAALLGACDASKGASPAAGGTPEWGQWGAGPRHDGFVDTSGQPPARLLADVVVDPFVALEVAEGGRGALLVHYQTPLVDGDDVFIEVKGGRYAPCDPPGSGAPFPCGPAAWAGQVWSERALRWDNGVLRERWGAVSDWVPPPNGGALSGWEPVFHAALSSGFVYLPARGGSVLKLRREDGRVAARIAPFQDERNTYVAGPLTADGRGNVYYQALKLDPADPWAADAAGAWLVRVGTDDQAATVPFASLVRDAPDAGAACTGAFVAGSDPLPWPPTAFARPRTGPCGRQRPGLNAAPAVAPDGTIYTVSRAHLNARYSYLVAVGPDLQPRWAASMRGLLDDGCGRLLPPNGAAGGCRVGTTLGVDPETNERPAGRVDDNSTASPVVAPDGSVLYGAFTRYNYSRGHLLRFDASGRFLASYDFGWDVTPAVVPRGASFSVVVKDNHYPRGSYCRDPTACPPAPNGPYHVTQLSPTLVPEWRHTNESSEVAGGFEWCINAPAVDRDGVVYGINEDGFLYAIEQGGRVRGRVFLARAIGASYTPVALGRDGRIYTENYGRMFVAGR